MAWTRYDKIETKRRKTGKCSECGKRCTKSKTFYQTHNPFNKDEVTGLPKTPEQIYSEIKGAADKWMASPHLCFGCFCERFKQADW